MARLRAGTGRVVMSFIRQCVGETQSASMRLLPEDQLVRRAVLEGVGRVLRQLYTEEQVGPPTEHIAQLVARLPDDSSHNGPRR